MKRSALNLVLAVGFLALTAGTFVAWRTPATAYEASIYAGTPTATWAGFGVALAVAVGATLACRGRKQALAIALGATSVTAIVSLPTIRSYRYIGTGDSLTHLGWVRDITNGVMNPHELFYPGFHSLASLLHLVGGVSLERSVLLTVVVLFVPFLAFVPLAVRDVTGNATAVAFAAIASWLVLPINNISTYMGAHTNSNALFFVPVIVFATVAYLRRRSDLETLPLGISPFGALVFATGVALLLVHPQQMANVVVLLGAISLVQFVVRRRYDDHPIAEHATVYSQTGLLAIVFGAWVVSNPRFRRSLAGLVVGLLESDIGADSEVGQRGTSLAEIGGSLPEIFAKLFLVSAIVGLIVGLFILLTWLGRTRLDLETKAFVTYFGIALFPLTGIFVLYFVGTPTMAFRQIGFLFVLITILAGLALAQLTGWLGGWITKPGANALAAAFLGACLVLSLATLFGSPFIYSPSQHVTDQQLSGYETAFEHDDDETPYAGMGFAVTRYDHGINGVDQSEGLGLTGGGVGEVTPEEFNDRNYADAYRSSGYYFVVTSWDVEREIGVYQELNHDEEALEGVDRYEGANKVISNDDFRMYTVSSVE